MPGHLAVIGQAGTGKTTWLMEQLNHCWFREDRTPNQRVLGLTFMHGARRRLDTKLRESCPTLPKSVRTVDSFSLSIVNRWRSALGLKQPVVGGREDADFVEELFGVRASFERIAEKATELLTSPTVASVMGLTHPVIVIDEFQDFHGARLELVRALGERSQLLVAGDDFQLLDSDVRGCPAVEWILARRADGSLSLERLAHCHRTDHVGLLHAAACIRDNVGAVRNTIPMFQCDGPGPAAYKIIEAMVYRRLPGAGPQSWAVISPSRSPWLDKVLTSCANQLTKKGLNPIRWHKETSQLVETAQLLEWWNSNEDGLHEKEDRSEDASLRRHVADQVRRFARLKGLPRIDHALAVRFVEKAVHDSRAFGPRLATRVVTTVHGAKNQEFDHVVVLWPHLRPSSTEQQRRLLYNAITRARKSCLLLVQGNEEQVRNDPVLRLLGSALPVFPDRKRASRRPTS